MLDYKPADTTTVQNKKLGVYLDQEPADKERYQRLVGKLIYLSHTRPDISYGVSLVSQFMHCPSKDHMEAVGRILRYLKSAPGRGLMFSKNGHLDIEGYTDADWAGNLFDRKSRSSYFTFVGGDLVTWRSKKQKVVALSSAEAELRGMPKGFCELLWIRRLLSEIGFTPKSGMNLYCDNKLVSPVCLIPRAQIHLSDGTMNHLEVSLTRPLLSTLMLQVYERRCLPRDPSLDHFHYEYSGHFPELGMDQSWLLALFSPS